MPATPWSIATFSTSGAQKTEESVRRLALPAVGFGKAGEEMRGVRVADDENCRLPRVFDRRAVIVLEEARRALSLLLEGIARLVTLIEAAHQSLALCAVRIVIENARYKRRESGGETLRVVGQPTDDARQREQA